MTKLSTGLFPGPSLEDLLKDFIKKNKLPKIKNASDTSLGKLIALNDGSQFILYCKVSGFDKNLQPRLNSYIGGRNPGKYMSICTKFSLEGELKGKKVCLEAEVSESQHYEEKKSDIPCSAPIYIEKGKPKTSIERNDRSHYWFLTNALKKGVGISREDKPAF